MIDAQPSLQLFSIPDVARRLKLSDSGVRYLIRKGQIRIVRMSPRGRVRISALELTRFIADREAYLSESPGTASANLHPRRRSA